jgi:uncharacterized protein YggE
MITAIVAAFVFGTAVAATQAKSEYAPVAQTGSMNNTITVNGSGQASGTPDMAVVQLGIEVNNTNASEALALANTTIANVTKAVEALGIAATDIQTSGFNLYPQNQPDQVAAPGAVQSNGGAATAPAITYQAQISISVQVKDISKIGAVIDAGTKAGANTVAGLSFGIADQSKLEQQARIEAVKDAHDRAQQLADALNMTLGDPIIVSENGGGGGPVPMAFKAVAASATQVNPGQLSVSVDLQITYSMTKK